MQIFTYSKHDFQIRNKLHYKIFIFYKESKMKGISNELYQRLHGFKTVKRGYVKNELDLKAKFLRIETRLRGFALVKIKQVRA